MLSRRTEKAMPGEYPVLIGKEKRELASVLQALGLSAMMTLLMALYEHRKALPTGEVQLAFTESDEWILAVLKRHRLSKLRLKIQAVAPKVQVMSSVEWVEKTFPPE